MTLLHQRSDQAAIRDQVADIFFVVTKRRHEQTKSRLECAEAKDGQEIEDDQQSDGGLRKRVRPLIDARAFDRAFRIGPAAFLQDENCK